MIKIIGKTKDFVVIYKPPIIPSQPDPSGDKDAMTITSELLRSNGEDSNLFLIHRLDRVVGGLLVFGRNKKAAAQLSSLVAEHKIKKEYFAVVQGVCDNGTMRDLIYKDAALNKAFVTNKKRSGAKEAELEYKTLGTVKNNNDDVSLVRVRLKTGRFHQIRVQFSSRKMPLIGDKKYGSRDFVAKNPALFACLLSFEFEGKLVSFFTTPDISVYPWSLFGEECYIQ